jgi:SAM-dependent methyltransferase
MALIRQGIVKRFDLFDLSSARLARARLLAEECEVADRVDFFQENAFKATSSESYDFVHWNNSMHHMPRADAAVAWSRRILRSDGVFFMDDYVGASRFQHSDRSLRIASMVRSALPERYLTDPENPDQLLPKNLDRPDKKLLAREDPSEAADSDRILPSVRRCFPNAEITLTGGVVYHLALSDVLANFDDERDKALLGVLLVLDDVCVDISETHYATALAFKTDRSKPFGRRVFRLRSAG